MSHALTIAIDGPSGAGKSTLSKLVAARLGYTNIDTGAMYRAVALAAHRQGLDLTDAAALTELAKCLDIRFVQAPQGERVLLDGVDVSEAIRTPENSLRTAQVAACAGVREAMVSLQRKLGARGGVVLEGRDIGTVVFPHAELKIFLIATAEERGRRRWEELRAKGLEVELQQTIAEVEARDRADQQREHAPLVQAADAVVLDTTGLDIDAVLTLILDQVEAVTSRQPGKSESR
ncbi:MAG TPA: (d)CMP kinase [Geothermobacteraceae bacterium]|nr:(d)CMP kinase [Geothermobacteraceae bacterium]